MSLSHGVLSQDAKIIPILSYANANADRASEVIDTAGFGRCLIAVHFGDIDASAVTNIYLQNSDVADDENTLNTGTNVAGSSQTVAADDDNEVKYIDFIPTKRYYQAHINKNASNPSAESAIAILYEAGDKPTAHGAGGTTVGEGTDLVEGEYLGAAIAGTI